MSEENHYSNFKKFSEKFENSKNSKMSLETMDSSLGILDLDNLSTFTDNKNTTSFNDRISLISEKTKQKVSLLYKSQSQPVFKVPDTSTTNALLSKRMFPQTFQNSLSMKHSLSDDIPVKDIPSANVSQGSLDSRYFRECSDSEWRFTGTMDETDNQTQASLDLNKMDTNLLSSFSRNNFENILLKNEKVESRKDSVVTEGLPTPFKGNQSIIGMNNSTETLNSLTLDFRNDQISARSSSLSGSSTAISGGSSTNSSNSNRTSVLKSKLGTNVLTEISSQPNANMDPTNPFDLSGIHVGLNALWMPPDNVRLSFPNSFDNEFQAVQLGNEDFLSGGDAIKLLEEGEVAFLKDKELELPDELPLDSDALSFGTCRNTSTVSRPSFVNSVFSNGEMPDRVTKDMLFKAKSDPLGGLGRKSNTLRPHFGLDVRSPGRNDITNASIISEYKLESSNDHSTYISELVKDLSITIPDNRLMENVNERKRNRNLSKISEVLDSSALSVPSYKYNEGMIKVTRSHSANEVDLSSPVDIRKCHSMGDLSPEKKGNPFVFPDHYGSFHSLPYNTVCSQKGGQSFGFCPSHHSPSLLQINPHFNGPASCLQCYDNATRMNNFAATQYPHPSPLPNYPYQVPLPPTNYGNFYYPEQNMTQNEIIRGPSELSAGYVCWGSNSKINIPLINPSNKVLSCDFTIVTVFMGSQKVKPEKLGIVLPSNCDIPPRATKESTVSLSALEEGVFNLWIEITTTVPCLHTTLGSFMCHITLNVEYPKLVVEIPNGKCDNVINFDISLAQDEDMNTLFIKIMSHSKAITPIIVFLQTEQSEDFQYIFPEKKIREIMMKSSNFCQILSSTILLFQIKGETKNGNAVLIPITIAVKNKTIVEKMALCIIKGSVTVGLQCPNKEDQDLEKISLCAKIRRSRSLTSSNVYSTVEEPSARPGSKRTSELVRPTSRKGNLVSAVRQPNEAFNNRREIAETDGTISKLDMSSFMEMQWIIEPTTLHFRQHNQELEFCIRSSILLWMQISYPKDVFKVNPDQGICKPNSKLVVKVKLLSVTKSMNVEEIKVTCDGLEKVLKVIVRDLHDFSSPS